MLDGGSGVGYRKGSVILRSYGSTKAFKPLTLSPKSQTPRSCYNLSSTRCVGDWPLEAALMDAENVTMSGSAQGLMAMSGSSGHESQGLRLSPKAGFRFEVLGSGPESRRFASKGRLSSLFRPWWI